MRDIGVFNSSVWLISEKIFSMALNFIVMLVVARYLAPSYFGKLSYMAALIGIVSPVCSLGLNAIITKDLVSRPGEASTILGSALCLRLLGCIVVGAISIVLTFLFLDPSLKFFFICLVVSNIFTSFSLFDYWIQSYTANQYAAKARLFVLLFVSFLKIMLVLFDASFHFFVYVYCLEILLGGLAFFVVYLTSEHRLSLQWSYPESIQLLKRSWYLMLSGVAAVIYLKIDQVMLGYFYDDKQVGLYALASRLSEVWYFFPTAVVISFFPHLIKKRGENLNDYTTLLQKLNDALFLSALILAVLVTFTSESLVPLIFGDQYAASATILIIHIWAGIFIFMRSLLSKWLIAENLLKFSLVTQVAGAVINIVLNVLWIPSYGGVGAAFATVVSYSMASYVALFFHSDTRPMARVMSMSIILPLRLMLYRNKLYCQVSR